MQLEESQHKQAALQDVKTLLKKEIEEKEKKKKPKVDVNAAITTKKLSEEGDGDNRN